MNEKKRSRLRRARRTRGKIARLKAMRLCIHRSPRHFYAQIFDAEGQKVLVMASTLDKDIRSKVKNTGNIEAATAVGEMIAERAKEAGIGQVAFDRSGFKYHGRVKAFAESARDHGMKI